MAKIYFVPLQHYNFFKIIVKHRSGFVNIVGKPNVGKSTLMNILVGQKLSIVTAKAQTTRHRIRGIINEEDYQIIFSDTPGIIKPAYLLQNKMMDSVKSAMNDADIILYMVEANDEIYDEEIISKINSLDKPILLVINKIDLIDQKKLENIVTEWRSKIKTKEIIPISATANFNTSRILQSVIANLPEHPPYFPKDQFTDLPEKFFVAEIIREKILLYYKKEIPYSVEVQVESFKDEKKIVKIRAIIITERETQKGILIGHKGVALKKVGTQARKGIEQFLGKQIYLELFVKVREGWRDNEMLLGDYGL